MPRRALISSEAAGCRGAPQPRLLPWPRISRGCFAPTAQATASCSCSGVWGFRISVIRLASCTGAWGRQLHAFAPSHPSESRDVGEGQLAAMDVHAAQFGAAVQLREDLARVQQVVRVERALHPLLLLEVDLVEHGGHEVALFHPYPVFAGQDAADRDTGLEDLGAALLRPLQFAGLVGVIENQGV